MEIKFKRNTNSALRNGMVTTTGIGIYLDINNSVSFKVINSRGLISTGHIQIPIESIPEITKKLNNIYDIEYAPKGQI